MVSLRPDRDTKKGPENKITTMSKVHFCTFGTTPNYGPSLARLVAEARIPGYFDTVTAYTQDTLPATPAEKAFMQAHRRGYGYWIWKANVILDVMSKVGQEDIIVYADAGCGISGTTAARTKFAEWIRDANEHPTHRVSFQMPHVAETWTKADVFALLDCSGDEFRKTGQHIGGIQIYKNTGENQEFVRTYKRLMETDNYHYVTDAPSRIPNHPSFQDHRHDQAILSLLFKRHGSANREDHWRDPSFPIMALRRRAA